VYNIFIYFYIFLGSISKCSKIKDAQKSKIFGTRDQRFRDFWHSKSKVLRFLALKTEGFEISRYLICIFLYMTKKPSVFKICIFFRHDLSNISLSPNLLYLYHKRQDRLYKLLVLLDLLNRIRISQVHIL